jgi:hypothetical protein
VRDARPHPEGREYVTADFEVKLARLGIRTLVEFPIHGGALPPHPWLTALAFSDRH